MDIAENDRRKRAAIEIGKRQAEENLLSKEDQLYTEIQKVHQNSVDYLLCNLMNNIVDKGKIMFKSNLNS